jgi:DNA end-binding protein Ku
LGLHAASIEQGDDFDWLHKRSMDPVGYKRISKTTGKEIDKDDIVSSDEIGAVFPRTTQTIEIQLFLDANESPFMHLERPHYVAPINKDQKVYALLREVLIESGKVGLAKVVIATKKLLAYEGLPAVGSC